MQLHGSSQVSPQIALGNESVRARAHTSSVRAAVCFAGVAQLVEHLFCKQVVRGSSPRASSGSRSDLGLKSSESCPSGQREQAVNLPAFAYAGSNPALSTITPRLPAGTNRNGYCSTDLGRGRSRAMTSFAGVAQLVERQPSKLNVEGSSPFSRSKSFGSNLATRRHRSLQRHCHAHLAQMVEHVLGKDEVTSSILVVGSKP